MEVTIEALRRWREAIDNEDTRQFDGICGEMSQAIATLEASSVPSDEWFSKLWGAYPKNQHDGATVPLSAKGETLKRFKSTCKRHGITPENLAKACMLYVRHARENKMWVPSLQVLLGNQKCYWEGFLPKGE